MLPKAHLTSHSRMSGSRWVITPWWLSGSWKSILYNSSVHSYHLFLISSVSIRSIPFLPLIVPTFAWNVPLVSLIFLKRSLVFPILLFSSISMHWSLRKAFLCLLAILWNSAFKWVHLSFSPLPLASLFFSAIFKSSSDNHFAFCISFSWGWFWPLPPVQCQEPPSIVLQALYVYQIIPWTYLSLPLYNHKGFVRSYLNGLVLFLLCLHLFILSGVISPVISSSILGTYWPGGFICHCPIFLLYHTFNGVLKQEYLSGLPFASPTDHVLSELSTMTRLSWVALHGMAHSFIELDKAVVHVISLVSFLWLWFSFCLPSEG